MAGPTRAIVGPGENGQGERLEADRVLKRLTDVLNGKVIQIGGDATTGRGLVTVRIVEGGAV